MLFFTLKECKCVHPSIMWRCRMYIQDQKYGSKSRSHQQFFNTGSEAQALTRRRKNGSASSLESRTDVKAEQQWRSINHWHRQRGLFFTTANERCCDPFANICKAALSSEAFLMVNCAAALWAQFLLFIISQTFLPPLLFLLWTDSRFF